jgi:hypothetical protein
LKVVKMVLNSLISNCVQSPAVFWWRWDQIEGTRDFRTNLSSKL